MVFSEDDVDKNEGFFYDDRRNKGFQMNENHENFIFNNEGFFDKRKGKEGLVKKTKLGKV